MKLSRNISLLSSLFFMAALSGCSTLDVNVPLASIKSPEVIAKGQHQITASAEASKHYIATNDASQRPPVFDLTNESAGVLNTDYSISFVDGLLVGAGMNSDFGFHIQGQYQFLNLIGEDHTGWLSSVYANIYYDETNRSGNQKGLFGPGGYDWGGRTILQGAHAGTSLGYRFNQQVMGYIGYAHNLFSLDTRITQNKSDDNLDAGGNYNAAAKGSNKTIGLGAQIDIVRVHIMPSIAWTDYIVDGVKQEGIFGSLSVAVVLF
jgi:hypothetical protein